MARLHGEPTGDSCVHCGEDRVWKSRGKKKGGHRPHCHSCHKRKAKEYRDKFPEKNKEARLKESAKKKKERREVKAWAIEFKGGECEVCGFKGCQASFDLHHRDASKKNFPVTSMELLSKPFNEVVNELNLCALLCANCHREHHYNEGESDE